MKRAIRLTVSANHRVLLGVACLAILPVFILANTPPSVRAAGSGALSEQPGEKAVTRPVEEESPTAPVPAERQPSAIPTLASGDLYALLVGISKYKNEKVPALKVSEKDAHDFAEFLEGQKELFRKVYVTVMTGEKATKFSLEKYLYYRLREAGKNDTVLLFFSGHGAIDPKRPGEFFFLTYDSDPDFLEASALNMSGLRFLKALDCPRIVLMADACHAGGFSRAGTKLAVIPMKSFVRDFSSSSGRVVITSSRPEEYSLEKPTLGNSVFTHYLLEGLKGSADADGNGVITVNEAYNFVYDRTKADTRGAQHPQFDGSVEGLFPLSVPLTVGSRPATSLVLAANPPAADVFVSGKFVGKTSSDGSLCLKYLPLGRPIGVKLRKEGWLDKEIGPYVFSKDRLQIRTRPVKLKPALASFELRTSPGRVEVTIDGRTVGKTDGKGRLIVHNIQVAVPHHLILDKGGYEQESRMLTIPVAFQGQKFKSKSIALGRDTTRIAPERSAPRERTESPRPSRKASPRRERDNGTSEGTIDNFAPDTGGSSQYGL